MFFEWVNFKFSVKFVSRKCLKDIRIQLPLTDLCFSCLIAQGNLHKLLQSNLSIWMSDKNKAAVPYARGFFTLKSEVDLLQAQEAGGILVMQFYQLRCSS